MYSPGRITTHSLTSIGGNLHLPHHRGNIRLGIHESSLYPNTLHVGPNKRTEPIQILLASRIDGTLRPMPRIRYAPPNTSFSSLTPHPVLSALVNRYTPYVTLPYFIALASQLLAAAYAFFAIRETLRRSSDTSSDDEEDSQSESSGIIERAVERVKVPVKPLRVLMPWRDDRGVLHWELTALAVSLFATTCGVRPSAFCLLVTSVIRLMGAKTVFVPTAVLFFLSDKFNFNTEKACIPSPDTDIR